MGVRGLTTYIGTNAERYLEPFELHDCELVIDGDNLCMQLFVRSEDRTGAFGGNYDHYFRAVVAFFELLSKCNVKPFVLLDGGYEKSKLKTVCERFLGRIQVIKHVKAVSSRPIIPLLIREVFVDALRASKVPIMRCLFEADNEIAVLARKLDCPVLSYDSDFYIHNVKYIPYVTVTHKIYRKVIENDQHYAIELVDRRNKRKHRVLAKQGEGEIQIDLIKESYCYLDCSLYTIESLIGPSERLKPEMLPLFAALLGNDYIERRVLTRFYASMRVGKISRKVAPQQRWIEAILKWLQHHSVKSATTAVLGQVREKRREGLTRQLRGAMYGYNCEECSSYEYFGFEEQQEEIAGCASEKFLEYLETPEVDNLLESDLVDEINSSNDEENSDEVDEISSGEEREENEPDDKLISYTSFKWDPWLREIYHAALTPRFVMDLYYSSQYINYPQVEDISRPDSNSICYEVLKYIFALLKSTKNGKNFRYLTRVEKMAKYQWIKFENIVLPEAVTYDPDQEKNMPLFRIAFENFSHCDDIFTTVDQLPANLQLYFVCLAFWAAKSSDVTCVHIHTVILCIIQLQMVDKHLTNRSRDLKVFQTNLKSYLEAQKKSVQKVMISDQQTELVAKCAVKKLASSVTKSEATLTYEILLPHFSIPERYQRKHTEFNRQVAHTFAELQAVALNLFTLNALLRHPFEPLRIHELYNGIFLHNVYQSLKSRTDPMAYVRGTIFRYSGTLFAIHQALYQCVLKLAPQVEAKKGVACTKTKVKKNSKSTGEKDGRRQQRILDNDCVEREECNENTNDSEQDEFEDLNNQFSQLLRVRR
ncbi:protein asteroid [Topomyia yanbarensis]|uniref:protein asteroid n=1 Tax=Topomyia yanbarensis TaxID=2498891 RepID=UPI00273BFCDF|nr:protein asteroid [Topomyia yanbarensis]XP_058815446.1 protein asteroid [Topomyia yanbarensis]